VSLAFGVLLLALAVMLGGMAALFRHRSEGAMSALRTFALVGAASIALLHLLPEALGEVGWLALIAAAAGLLAPAVLERVVIGEAGAHRTPTTALAMGYAAVLAHQFGEGAAVASLSRVGQLTLPVVLALAAHTVPLAMVVAIQVLEVRAGTGGKGAMSAALAGIALATVIGAFATRLVDVERLEAVEPWLLSAVAGLLLHALSHEAVASGPATTVSRAGEAMGGLLGLALATIGIDEEEWVQRVPFQLQIAALVVLAGLIFLRSYGPRRAAERPH
jgi:ZIP family zinc transporter